MTDTIQIEKEEIRKKIPNFVKLPTALEEAFVEYFYKANVLPDKVGIYDRVSLSEEITIMATVNINGVHTESQSPVVQTEYHGFTYNHCTKQVTSQRLK